MKVLERISRNTLREIEDYAILLLDPDGNIKDGNTGSEKIKGYKQSEIVGNNISVFYTKEDLDKKLPQTLLAEAKLKGKVAAEGWRVRKDGSIFWADVVITALHDSKNHITGYSKITRDLTEHHRQHEFDNSNLYALINNTADLIWSVDSKYNLITSNRPFDEVMAYMLGRKIERGEYALPAGFTAANITKYKNAYDRAFRGETFTETEHTTLPHENWTEISFNPIREGVDIVGVACYARDITQKKLAEEKQKNSERRFRSLIENSSDAIAIMNPEGTPLYVSPPFSKISGYSHKEALCLKLFDFMHPDDIPAAQQLFEKAMVNPGVAMAPRIARMRHKDGRWLWIETVITNMLHDPAINGIVDNFRDVSDRKLTEEKLQYSNRLYAFLTQMNHAMVRATCERTIYKDACRIAVENGKFTAAWISMISIENNTVTLLEECGLNAGDLGRFVNTSYTGHGPHGHVSKTGANYICNDIEKYLTLPEWKTWMLSRGIHSIMVLPIKESGVIVGTFNLYAAEINFFNEEEIKLLERATEDISYAINVKKKERLKKEADELLKHSEHLLNQSQAIAHFGSWEHDFSQPYALWSAEHCRIYGLSPEDNAHSFEGWLSFVHPDDSVYVRTLVGGIIQKRSSGAFSHRIIRKDGSVRHVQSHIHTRQNNDQVSIGLYGVTQDITKQVIADIKLVNANRLYSFTSHINQTIVRVTDEQTLFNDVCRIAVQIGKFELAWIGAIDDVNKKVKLIAENGAVQEDKEIFCDANFDEKGFTGNVLQKGDYHAINDFSKSGLQDKWRKYTASRGFNSAIALPIRKSGKIVFTFNLFSKKPSFFNSEEIALLEEAADDVSFALDVFEKEKLRKEAESKLKHSEERLNQAQGIAHLGSWERSFATNRSTWSDEHCKIFGIAPENNLQTFESWLSFIHPEDVARVKAAFIAGKSALQSVFLNYRIIKKDGAVRHIYSECHFDVAEDGKPTGSYGIAHDITDLKEAELKLMNVNRLYAFRSELSHTIVRTRDEQTLFNETCRIAVEIGKFDFAWIGVSDPSTQTINLVAQNNVTVSDINIFDHLKYKENGPTANVLRYGSCHVISHFDTDVIPESVKKFAYENGFKSGLAIPISKTGGVCYTLNLFSSVSNVFDPEEILLVKETARDISFALDVFEKETLKIQAEKDLKHSESRLKQAQEIAHIGNWELNFATGVALWSDEACRIYGLATDNNKHTYADWISYIHPDDLRYVLTVIKESEATLSNSSYYHRIIKQDDGAIRYIHSQAQYEFNNEGRPVGLYGVSHDVTEVKEGEAALTQSKENLRMIMDLLPQAVFAKDYNGKFVFVNKSFANLYGLTPKQLVYQTVTKMIPLKNEPEYFIEQDRKVIESGSTQIIPELKFVTEAGEERIFYTTKVPYILPGKNEKAVLGIALDITEQKKAEEERAKIVADIIQRNKDLEQFSYIVSHNLRAPVANIIGLSQLMQIAKHDEEDELAMMRGLSASVGKLNTVIKDLNYILEIKNQLSEKRERVILDDLLNDILFSVENMISKENVKIVTDFSEINELFTIKSYLYSVFFNLITNSIKYRQPGIQPEITITSSRENNKLELTFRDNGLGIDLDRVGKNVFGLYKRFHNHTEGKGMGLYMTKTQVETLGGKISVLSEVNKGTTFKIVFGID